MRHILTGRVMLAIALSIGLSACGFTPVYAPGSRSAAALSDITVTAPKSEFDYLFVREMEERLGRVSDGSKLLKYKITIKGEGVESDTDRRRFVGTLVYEVIDQDSKLPLAVGAVDSFAGYSVSNGLFVSARQDAIKRLVVILADQVTRELYAKLGAPTA